MMPPDERDGDRKTDSPTSGRRMTDDGARLIIAEGEIREIKGNIGRLADGQDILSGVLIGRPHKDGTITSGLAAKMEHIGETQTVNAQKIEALTADMGDVKTAQADQARTLTDHGAKLDVIGEYTRKGALYIARGAGTLVFTALVCAIKYFWSDITRALPHVQAASAAVLHAAGK